MGTRYYIDVTCPRCSRQEKEVYYAPTCGFNTWACQCGRVVDLERYSGLAYEDASNREEIEGLIHEYPKKVVSHTEQLRLLKIAAGLFGDGQGNELGGNSEYERGACEVIAEYIGWPVSRWEELQEAIHSLAKKG